jgi:hypothetical protein
MFRSIGFPRAQRVDIERAVRKHLWRGEVDQAIEVVKAVPVKNPLLLKGLIEYLSKQKRYIPNYHERRKAGRWLATTKVEKTNDWTVSTRCKNNGLEWTGAGVAAIASLEVTRRNGELKEWRQHGPLARHGR